MAQLISRYLVDWDHFCRMWEEEENPDDALEGAEHHPVKDPYLSGEICLHDDYENDYSFELGEMPWLDDLDIIIRSLFSDYYEDRIRDLEDAFAYEEGGFTLTVSPANVKRLVEHWKEVNLDEADKVCDEAGLDEYSSFKSSLKERMAILEKGAAEGKGYVTLVG